MSVYVPLVNVESIDKAQISLTCTNTSFELTVRELEGKDYRLVITVCCLPRCRDTATFRYSSFTPHTQ